MIGARSSAQNLSSSRLPEFTEEEKVMINGSSDFFGLNHYTTTLSYNAFEPDLSVVSYDTDKETMTDYDITWPQAESSWLREVSITCYLICCLQKIAIGLLLLEKNLFRRQTLCLLDLLSSQH